MSGKQKKLVYICAPLKGDIEGNIEKALKYSKIVHEMGCIPIAPQIMLKGILDDSNPAERKTALDIGLELVGHCNELWVFSEPPSEGMRGEIELARERHIPVKRVCFRFEGKEVLAHGNRIDEKP